MAEKEANLKEVHSISDEEIEKSSTRKSKK